VNAAGASLTIAGAARIAFLSLPRENDPWDTDHFRFDLKTGLFFFDNFSLQTASVVTRWATSAASGLIEQFRAV